jgi:hypothetical protein
MKTYLILILVLFAAVACTQTSAEAYTDVQLEIALTDLSATRTQAADGQLIVLTPSPAPTLPETSTQSPSLGPEEPHQDGIYIVGAEIAPGIWHSISTDQNFCYWARRKYDGIILASYIGLPGIDIRILETDYEVELDGCGMWIYLGSN